MTEPIQVKPKCIFCRIGQGVPLEGSSEATELLYEDETFAAFRDHRPAGEHHYLIIPKRHIRAFNNLEYEDTPMIKDMAEVAKKVLTERIGRDVDDALLGFHWPFYTVGHLHLHAIWPPNQMSLLQKFEFSRLLFGSVSEALHTLEKRKKKT